MLREVKELRKRKIRLLGVCDAQREMFLRDWKQIEARLHWLESGSALMFRFKPSLLVAAPLAGILVSLVLRKKVRFAGIVEQVSHVWGLVNRLRSLFRGINVAKQMVAKDWPE
ncbi:MAG: hypothetical protein LBH01_10520 [Verrucomicrobiales bacterium]|jgi:hypothetical protein|nr:hypothetical protein [Verrucomicrobiales bacterium]